MTRKVGGASTLALLGGTAALLVLYGRVLGDLAYVWWTDETYSHGMLVPAIAGYLVWRERARLAALVPQPCSWGVVVIALALVLRVFGDFVDTVGAGTGGLFIKGISLVILLAGLTLYVFGVRIFRMVAVPLAYLLFMVPLPAGVFAMLTLPLQSYATSVTTTVLHIAGIPVFREGNVITLPHVTLGVVEACSGIRSVIVLLALATAIAFLFVLPIRRWWYSVLLIASAVPIAVATNAFRVTATGFLAHFIGEGAAQGFYHDFSGWLVFLAAFGILGAFTKMLSRTVPAGRDA